MSASRTRVDVCLILEGTYPYVSGGVSSWTHDLLTAMRDLSFHLVTLLPGPSDLQPRYKTPDNVVSTTPIHIRQLPKGELSLKLVNRLFERLEEQLLQLQSGGGLAAVSEIMEIFAPYRRQLGRELLLNSRAAWEMLLRMYRQTMPQTPFLDYFWSWRALLGGFYSMLFAELPAARVYHTVSTGYAGLLAARAHLETGRPVLLTEHGIYTNERRIDIAMSDWPYEAPFDGYQINTDRRDLKRLWIETFVGYSRACYEACSKIITLYEGNQQFQVDDGADPRKMQIIPNGIDYARFSSIGRHAAPHPPTVALIGRVVPIKDIKTFIRACAALRGTVPDLQAWILGPTEEDESYYRECQAWVRQLGLEQTVTFTGKVKLDDYLGKIDVVVLTSLSEAQPLVILEAGAAGIPTVATNVGACSELILGGKNESPALGPGGTVTPLANPTATAQALARLLTDQSWYEGCGRAIRERVRRYYNKMDLDNAYRNLYESYRMAPEAAPYLVRVR